MMTMGSILTTGCGKKVSPKVTYRFLSNRFDF